MQTRHPRLGGCRSHGWRGQAALEPQLLCAETPALAVHGARWGRCARGGWEGPGPSCPAHTRIFSRQPGNGDRLPLHGVPLSVSTCTFVSPLARLLPPLAWEPLTWDCPGRSGLGAGAPPGWGWRPAVPLAPRSCAGTDACRLLRFDPRSDPVGQAVFPHLTDEEAGAQRVNGSPKVTRSCGPLAPPRPSLPALLDGSQPSRHCPPRWFWSMSCLPWPDKPPGSLRQVLGIPGCPSGVPIRRSLWIAGLGPWQPGGQGLVWGSDPGGCRQQACRRPSAQVHVACGLCRSCDAGAGRVVSGTPSPHVGTWPRGPRAAVS